MAVIKWWYDEVVDDGTKLKLACWSFIGLRIFSSSLPWSPHWLLRGVDACQVFAVATTACRGITRAFQLPGACAGALACNDDSIQKLYNSRHSSQAACNFSAMDVVRKNERGLEARQSSRL